MFDCHFVHMTDKVSRNQTCINIDCKPGTCQTWPKYTYRILRKVGRTLDFKDSYQQQHNYQFDRNKLDWRNLITYCYIHNDSTVELSKCGTLIASFEVAKTEKVICKFWFAPMTIARVRASNSPHIFSILAIHSLKKGSLGQYICSYAMDSEEILMSLSFSPSSEYLLVGVRSSNIYGCFLKVQKSNDAPGNLITNIPTPKWIISNEGDPFLHFLRHRQAAESESFCSNISLFFVLYLFLFHRWQWYRYAETACIKPRHDQLLEVVGAWRWRSNNRL